jgi:hypothetical protein
MEKFKYINNAQVLMLGCGLRVSGPKVAENIKRLSVIQLNCFFGEKAGENVSVEPAS